MIKVLCSHITTKPVCYDFNDINPFKGKRYVCTTCGETVQRIEQGPNGVTVSNTTARVTIPYKVFNEINPNVLFKLL